MQKEVHEIRIGNNNNNNSIDQISQIKRNFSIGSSVDVDPAGPRQSLTLREKGNLCLCLLAWACTVANVTLVVGTSAQLILSVGERSGVNVENLASIPLAAFFLGSSLVSLCLTPWLFSRGRKKGFVVGIFLGLIGTALCSTAIYFALPALVIGAFPFFGASMGIGFFLRFAAIELVPAHWSSRAMTLVVSGGVIAAVAGPESAGATVDLFASYPYMGVVMMTGIFGTANGLFTVLVRFSSDHSECKDKSSVDSRNKVRHDDERRSPSSSSATFDKALSTGRNRNTFIRMIRSRQFLVPMFLSGLAWGVMAMPMSIVRVAMENVGYTSRQSLTVIEVHFLSMVSAESMARNSFAIACSLTVFLFISFSSSTPPDSLLVI